MGALSQKSLQKRSENLELKKLSYKIDADVQFTGNQLFKCPFTGFYGFISPMSGDPVKLIEDYKAGGASPFIGFSPSKKKLFIEKFPKFWPNVSKCLKAINGCAPMTYRRHINVDPLFSELIENINRENVDDLKNNMVKFSKRPKNFMDRMAVGRLYAPEEFDPARRLIVENRKSVDTRAIQSRLTNIESCVDAELVPFAALPPKAEVLANVEPAALPAPVVMVEPAELVIETVPISSPIPDQRTEPIQPLPAEEPVKRKRGRPRKIKPEPPAL